jgi:hypothetical protein
MRRHYLSASLFALLVAATPVRAQPATSEGAKALAESFALYFGHGALDQGIIAVTPQGEDYKVVIDLQKAVDQLGLPPGTATLGAMSILTTPQPGDKWKVAMDGFPNLALHMSTPDGDVTGSLASTGYKFEGVYDPKLAAFLTAKGSIDLIDLKYSAQGADASLQEEGIAFDVTSTDAGNGAVNATTHQTMKGLSETVKASSNGKQGGAGLPITISYKVGPMTGDASIEAMHGRAMLDLWAYLVSLGGPQEALEHQDELKEKLSAIFPIWNDLKVTVALNGITAGLPFGEIKMNSFSEKIAMSGLVPHGELGLGLRFEGLSLPPGLLPAWAGPLLPNLFDSDVKFTLEGLDEIAKTALEEADFSDDPPLSDDAQEKLGELWHGGHPKLLVDGLKLTSPSYDIAAQGELAITDPKPTGKFTITIDGFDKAFAIVQSAAKSEPMAQQALPGLALVKGLAKAGPNGKLSWEIALDADGGVSVNGQKMK